MTRTTLSRQPGPESGWRMPEGYGCNFWSLYLWVLHPKQSQRSCQRSYTCAAHEWGKRGNAGKGCRAKSQSHLKSVAELHWLRLALSPDFICSEGFLCNCYSVLMSNNCYRKGKVRRRQHKSRGICPDPAWTRHFTAGFHCAHGWRGASSLCQCHIKVQCVVQDFSIPGLQTGTAWAACEMSWEMGLQQDKGPRSSGDGWGNVKPDQSYRGIQETLAVRIVTAWRPHVGFTYQCFPKKVDITHPSGVTGAQQTLAGVRCCLVVRDDSPGWDCPLSLLSSNSTIQLGFCTGVFVHLWLCWATGTNSMAWEAAQDKSSCFPLSNLHPICGGAGRLPSFMNAWDCITSNLGYLVHFLLHIFPSSLQPASLNIWSGVGKIISVQRLEIALNQTMSKLSCTAASPFLRKTSHLVFAANSRWLFWVSNGTPHPAFIFKLGWKYQYCFNLHE